MPPVFRAFGRLRGLGFFSTSFLVVVVSSFASDYRADWKEIGPQSLPCGVTAAYLAARYCDLKVTQEEIAVEVAVNAQGQSTLLEIYRVLKKRGLNVRGVKCSAAELANHRAFIASVDLSRKESAKAEPHFVFGFKARDANSLVTADPGNSFNLETVTIERFTPSFLQNALVID